MGLYMLKLNSFSIEPTIRAVEKGMQMTLVGACAVSDYVPQVSTATNIAILALKFFYLNDSPPRDVSNNYFLSYVEKKDIYRCGLALIPCLGNIILAAIDAAEFNMGRRSLSQILLAK